MNLKQKLLQQISKLQVCDHEIFQLYETEQDKLFKQLERVRRGEGMHRIMPKFSICENYYDIDIRSLILTQLNNDKINFPTLFIFLFPSRLSTACVVNMDIYVIT